MIDCSTLGFFEASCCPRPPTCHLLQPTDLLCQRRHLARFCVLGPSPSPSQDPIAFDFSVMTHLLWLSWWIPADPRIDRGSFLNPLSHKPILTGLETRERQVNLYSNAECGIGQQKESEMFGTDTMMLAMKITKREHDMLWKSLVRQPRGSRRRLVKSGNMRDAQAGGE